MSDLKDRPVLGKNLILLRKKYGLTQAELAEKSGVSMKNYCFILKNVNPTRLLIILKN